MKIVEREFYPGTYDFIQRGKTVAAISLYEEGLIEFNSLGISLFVENVGTKKQVVHVNGVTINSEGLLTVPTVC